ncbi:MAG TPA: thiamine phosphate synthase [Pyrinomonadaceae bacterium]
MPPELPPAPLTYLVTAGETTPDTTPTSREFAAVLALVERAVVARVSLVQLREKRLPARVFYELAARAAAITRASGTRLLVNDRADIARAATCDGVHLTTQSLAPSAVRRAFGTDLLVGVSAHSLDEARAARDGGDADFCVLGPIFDTPSKVPYGAPLGLGAFRAVARALAPFPVLAIGGVTTENAGTLLRAGAAGVAAIRMFSDSADLRVTVSAVVSAGGRM